MNSVSHARTCTSTHTHTEIIWKDIHKILRLTSPHSGIMRRFKFLFYLVFVLLPLSSIFLKKWTQITDIIKNVENRLCFEYCDCKTGSLLFVPTKISFRIYNKNKTKVPLPSSETQKGLDSSASNVNQYKGKLVKGNKGMGSWPISSLLPLRLCPSVSKRYSSFSLLLISYVRLFCLG